MALGPVNFFFKLLIGCAFAWIFLIFAARVLAILLRRVVGVSVAFRVAGCNCLRDVIVQFKKGKIESVCIGEAKLCLRKSLVKLGCNVISREPKLQLLLCDFEIVIRPSEKKLKKPRSQKPSSTGKGKGKGRWIAAANMARFLSFHVTELVVKVPKATIEIKDLVVDISKHGGSLPTLCVKLHLLPFIVHMGDSCLTYEQSSTFNQGECKAIGQGSVAMMEQKSGYFICEELSLSCEFGHEREIGVMIKNVDITFGEVTVNLNEELFLKKTANSRSAVSSDSSAARKSQKKQNGVQSLTKYALAFPEKVSFNLSTLDVRFVHQGQGFFMENNITGFHLRSSKLQSLEEAGEATSLNVEMDSSEIHLLREGGTSVLAIMKLTVVSSFDVPLQNKPQDSLHPCLVKLTGPTRAKIDVKIGGSQCNIIMSRLTPWMRLHLSKKKRMVLPEENPNLEKSQKTDMKESQNSDKKVIMWACNISAPEITIVLYSLNDSPLCRACSQSLHLFANNIATKGTAVRSELGELHLHMSDEYQECSKESLFGVERNLGSLMHVLRMSLDWGHREIESPGEHDSSKLKVVLSVDVTSMGVNFSFKCVDSLISNAMSFQSLLNSFSASKKRTTQTKVGRSGKPAGRGTQVLKFNLDRCSVNFSGEVGVENAVVKDPKRVNFGSQGGEVVISVSADGTPRTANVASTMLNGCQNLKYSLCLDIFHVSLYINKEKRSTQMELERARSIYQECCEAHRPNEKVTLFDTQNAKFVRRSGGHNEMAVCSLFSATDISVRWEPDVHLSLLELILRLRCLIHNQKLRGLDSETNEGFLSERDMEPEKEAVVDAARSDKQNKKKDSVFAIDVEMLSVSAEVGDGVEAMIQVKSIFSENAKIGVLLEGYMLCLNEARVLKSSRMQISRVPKISASNSSTDSKVQVTTTWDWVIQGLDVYICMPYRLQLRAIEDAIEEMSRGLKLITAAKTALIFPVKKESSKQPKPKSTKLGRVRFIIRKIAVDIEEEPLQGWLDEHYHLMKKVVPELAVRLKFLDEIDFEGAMSEGEGGSGSTEPNELCSQKKFYHNGIEIDVHDSSSVQNLQDKIHKQAFRSYYEACQKLVSSEGSGACKTGFQAGFKPSTSRASLLSLCATELDVTLTKIEGDNSGMIEFIKKLDPIALESDIPFSRMLGKNIVLHTGSLAAHIRNYTYPIFFATAGKCEGRIVLAQQATCFQPQIQQDVYVGRWRKVCMLRSASGTTPPMKTYADLPLYFQKAEISFGVGFEPVLTDISYAFTVALRRANLSVRSGDSTSISTLVIQLPKKERSLPWWDEVRNYIHGKYGLYFTETRWNILGTTDPYEKLDKLQIDSGSMEILHSDGLVSLFAQDFRIFVTSLESLNKRRSVKLPFGSSGAFLESPSFRLEVNMDWECDSGSPRNHYLYALPNEKEPREKVYDPFRSTSLSLRWNFSLGSSFNPHEKQTPSSSMADGAILNEATISPAHRSEEHTAVDSPTMNVGAHDLAWVSKFWNMCYLPPQKLRTFSRWPRFGVPRVARSGNLSLDKVMTEFMLRFEVMPICIKHAALEDDDPASGLTIRTRKFKYEMYFGRGKQVFTFDCKRDTLDLVYQGVDLYTLKIYLNKYSCSCIAHDFQIIRKSSQTIPDRVDSEKCKSTGGCTEKHHDDGFLLSSNYFTIRKQSPKADPAKLLAWQEAGRNNLEMTFVRSEFENENDSDHENDPSDDDEFNVVVADNCQRVFVYGLKLLWTLKNRDAVLSWVGGLSKAFQPPKPSPSRQYAQRRLIEEKQRVDGAEQGVDGAEEGVDGAETIPEDNSNPSPSMTDGTSLPSPHNVEATGSHSFPSLSVTTESSSSTAVSKNGSTDDSEDGTRHFMVNIYEPQFNLHSEEANGRFLLAAVNGRVLARSFHSVLNVGYEAIEQALGTGEAHIPESGPEMTWQRMEFSVMLEHVQAHVAPTDVDPGAGVQWLPKIRRSSPKVKRTGALLERVFRPCTMYFRYTRHRGGNADLKMKPLKELAFNSPNITASMTSRQFQVMMDVLTNLLFARLPKPRKSTLSYACEDDQDVEEEADEVVPDGIEEVELARISLEQTEREQNLLLDYIRDLSASSDVCRDTFPSTVKDGDLWMLTGGKALLVQGLKKALGNKRQSKKAASASLRIALQKAAQLRLLEKEKNKSPSFAMRISLKINKVVWSMLLDGKSFAETEINNMIYDFDRDYKDIGVAQFTTKSFVLRNCLPNAKSDTLLSAWNPPSEWGRKVMLRVDAKQGASKDGSSPIELLQVEIYPLKIYLTETMYRMMWGYLFPEEEQDSQKRQEVWKVSTTSGSKRGKKGTSVPETTAASSHPTKESEASLKITAHAASPHTAGGNQASAHGDSLKVTKMQNVKANIVSSSNSELRRTSSFDRTWEENVAESVANEPVLKAHSSSTSSSKGGSFSLTPETQHSFNEESSKNKSDYFKAVKIGRLTNEEKKVVKTQDEKRSGPRKMREFHNIKISQVELLVTYEGSRFPISDLRLLMDTFHREEFIGTWRRLFSRVKKHIIWGVLKSVTGMQGKKFKDKGPNQREPIMASVSESDLNLSDDDGGQARKSDKFWVKRPSDGAGDGFVTSVKGLFNSQRRKAKALVLRTMRGEADDEFHGEWSEGEAELSPFARQLTITKAKKLIKRHTKKLHSKGQKDSGSTSELRESLPASPKDTSPYESDSSSASSPDEDAHD